MTLPSITTTCRMNITIITPLLPFPLDSGGAQAQYNMIDGLRKSHTITMVYPENAHNNRKALSHLRRVWPEISFKPYTLAAQYSNLRFFASKVERMLKLLLMRNSEKFKVERILRPYGYDLTRRFKSLVLRTIAESAADIVQVEFYPYLHVVDFLPSSVRKVFVHHELRYVRDERMTQPFSLSDAWRAYMKELKRDEIATLDKYDTVITLTETDKDLLRSDGVATRLEVSPAAISTEVADLAPWNGTLSFLGGSGHGPNQEGLEWLMEKVFARIDWSADLDGCSFRIIGKGWNERVVRNIPKERVEMLGFVPKLSTAMQGSALLVPILSGSGMRMKILEGAALGLPIITTTVGVEGLAFENGVSCLIADTPEEFAGSIIRLAKDEALRSSLASNAQRVFIDNYSKEALVEKRNKIYGTL